MRNFDTSKEAIRELGIELTEEQYEDLCSINVFCQSMPKIPVYNILLVLKTLGLVPTKVPNQESNKDSNEDFQKSFERKFGKLEE